MKQIIFISILVLTFLLTGCNSFKTSDKIDPMYYCDSKSDCVVVNFDCSSCVCDLKAINKNFEREVCKDFNGEPCDTVCEAVNYTCENHRCLIK